LSLHCLSRRNYRSAIVQTRNKDGATKEAQLDSNWPRVTKTPGTLHAAFPSLPLFSSVDIWQGRMECFGFYIASCVAETAKKPLLEVHDGVFRGENPQSCSEPS
jgi:hypothetical protein